MDFDIKTFSLLPSTQDYAMELAGRENQPEGLVVQALAQTKGQGRHGREWQSPLGNLYMSLILRPDCDAQAAGQVSFIAAAAVSDALEDIMEAGRQKNLKWPNDVLVDDRKIAGVLLNSGLKDDRAEWLVVGIGVNVLAAPEGAVSANDIAGGEQVPIHPFRDRVLDKFAVLYAEWQAEGFAPIRSRWLREAYGLNDRISATSGSETVRGFFRDIDSGGALVLETEEETRKIHAGDVYFGAV